MLILTRRPGETIVIDGNIRVKVLSVEGERVKLGIEAPEDITVLRQELLDEVRESNIAAARKQVPEPQAVAATLRKALARQPQ